MTENVAVEILAGRHFSIPERVGLGLWPHPPIKYEWLVSTLASRLTVMRFFPEEPRKTKAGEAVRESLTIENVDCVHRAGHGSVTRGLACA